MSPLLNLNVEPQKTCRRPKTCCLTIVVCLTLQFKVKVCNGTLTNPMWNALGMQFWCQKITVFHGQIQARLKQEGYRAKLGVAPWLRMWYSNSVVTQEWSELLCAKAFLWSLALLFLGLICVPGMPLWIVIPSIVLMQSLNSCTRAFNRAQLINFLPRDKIATYMKLVFISVKKSRMSHTHTHALQKRAPKGRNSEFRGAR